MFSSEQLNSMAKTIMESLGLNTRENCSHETSNAGKKNVIMTPAQALVVAGILGGVLEVNSILVDRDQIVQIVLEGSLKKKTEMEMMLDKIGSRPFDEVVKAILGRL